MMQMMEHYQDLSALPRIGLASPPSDGGPLAHVGMLGNSLALRELAEQIRRLKIVDTTVLISGESGVGKELVARALHNLSSRSAGRFEAINCAAIPETLLESQLFGHLKGAFTDAKTDRKGLFVQADRGTLFLDELGELPLGLQGKLLRVLQEKEVLPLAATTPVKVDARIIAATNRDLIQEIERKAFRSDLYFRVSVVEIRVPPLRARRDDIPFLVRHFITRMNERYGRDIAAPDACVMERLLNYNWPGNVRELQNRVERAVVLGTGRHLGVEDFFPGESTRDWVQSGPTFADEKARFERQYLVDLLESARGNVSRAARMAGKFRTDLYRLCSRHQIDPASFRK